MLRELCLEDMEPIRKWRNSSINTLRTPMLLTKEQQEEWYRDAICNRDSRSRFFGVVNQNSELIGYGGIENIQWENSIGEISLLMSPCSRLAGKGFEAAIDIIKHGFNNLNLHTIFAECYCNNTAVNFWHKVFAQFPGFDEVVLKNRKYVNGFYYNSMYFSVSK